MLYSSGHDLNTIADQEQVRGRVLPRPGRRHRGFNSWLPINVADPGLEEVLLDDEFKSYRPLVKGVNVDLETKDIDCQDVRI